MEGAGYTPTHEALARAHALRPGGPWPAILDLTRKDAPGPSRLGIAPGQADAGHPGTGFFGAPLQLPSAPSGPGQLPRHI
jgi:hypothetical protein